MRDSAASTSSIEQPTIRRLIVCALNLTTLAGVGMLMARLLSVNGWNWAEMGLLVCFLLSAPWTILGFWNALIGFLLLRLTRNPAAIVNPALARASEADPILARTALLMCIRHEDVAPVARRIALMRADLEASGHGRAFHIHLLSDSSDPASIEAEEAAIAALRAADPFPQEIHYRRRTDNAGYKAGNIREFCERAGADYDFMVTLDADSLMSAPALLRLVRVCQANPQLGILQTLAVGLPSDSFFARLFQFGMRQGMRTYTMGSAWWQGDCGPYWGHNALIRIAPFRDHCHLPILPGKPPLGGRILSHDQVEAALMRRAGFEVRVLPEEGGSYEENPPALPDFITRDLRWCQGNMQYFRLLGMKGLLPASRIQLFLAVMMYIGAPAWIIFILLGAVQPFLPQTGTEVFPVELGLTLFGLMFGMSLSPKLLGVLDLLLQARERRRYGGILRITAGALLEFISMTLLAPSVALAETLFMAGLPFGRAVIWSSQRRSGYAVSWSAAAKGLWPQFALAAGLLAILWHGAPGALPWAAPLLVGLFGAIPITVLTASPAFGRWASRWRICAIPEEFEAVEIVEKLQGRKLEAAEIQLSPVIPAPSRDPA
ncbi:glucans biosynthesis glucosyltransferase MdoH [Lacibacterium aquatile]|uniref:Glucans biosynthesis glucosyltransferase H n=1 Tax=Lacibacterium aquatile TaxID=1168082 RepID=A0ABW5DLP7_9PROT